MKSLHFKVFFNSTAHTNTIATFTQMNITELLCTRTQEGHNKHNKQIITSQYNILYVHAVGVGVVQRTVLK